MVVGVGKGTCRTLERLVADSLDALLYDNATFYAERLWAIRPNVRSLALLAETHMATGDFEGAVRVMRHSFPFVEHLRVTKKDRPALMKLYHRYGVCLYRTARLHEAELAFRYVTQHGSAREQSATLYYMGRVFQKTNRDSAEAFSEAVTAYPFNFTATEEYTCEAEKCDARLLEAVYADSRVCAVSTNAAKTHDTQNNTRTEYTHTGRGIHFLPLLPSRRPRRIRLPSAKQRQRPLHAALVCDGRLAFRALRAAVLADLPHRAQTRQPPPPVGTLPRRSDGIPAVPAAAGVGSVGAGVRHPPRHGRRAAHGSVYAA